VAAATTIIAVDVPVALLIAQNLLRALRTTSLKTVLMRPTAATCSRIGCRVALPSGCRIALLGECERGGSKRDSDRDAKSFDGIHFVFFLLPNQQIDNARRQR
jgi:hypothetical protein